MDQGHVAVIISFGSNYKNNNSNYWLNWYYMARIYTKDFYTCLFISLCVFEERKIWAIPSGTQILLVTHFHDDWTELGEAWNVGDWAQVIHMENRSSTCCTTDLVFISFFMKLVLIFFAELLYFLSIIDLFKHHG